MLHRLIYGYSEEFYGRHVHENGSTLGIMASGGTLANITALWCARNSCFGPTEGFLGVEEEGLAAALRHYGYENAVILGSSLMHYSIEKAAGALGIGLRNVVKIPVDRRNSVDVCALDKAVEECASRRWRVIAIVGVAGTTDCGSIDLLAEIAEIAESARIHFHVDAAWGAPLLFSKRHRHKLKGIERADSVTVDGHKQLYIPIGVSMLLLRNSLAAKVFEKQAQYILRRDSGDLGKFSIEGSRPGTSLFVHAALNVIALQGYEYLIDENIRKAQTMARVIAESDEFELLSEPETNILLYRYIPQRWRSAVSWGRLTREDNECLNAFNEAMQKTQYEAGRTFVSRTKLSSLPRYRGTSIVALRAVIGNPLTGEEDIKAVLADQSQIAVKLHGAVVAKTS
jgi:glutamate decarboxylase